MRYRSKPTGRVQPSKRYRKQRRRQNLTKLMITLAWIIGILIVVGLWVVSGYVAYHFIAKYW